MTMNKNTKKTIGRVAMFTTKPAIALIAFFSLADLAGTLGWTNCQVDEQSGLFSFAGCGPVGWWTLGATAVLWTLTSVIQFILPGMAFRAGCEAYIAGFQFWSWAFESLLAQDVKPLPDQMARIHDEWGGLSYMMALYIPSHIFDMLTDGTFYVSTPLNNLGLLFGISSALSEQMAFMASTAKTLAEEAEEEINERPR